MKVISSILDAEKEFYQMCLDAQSEWASQMGYGYEIYEGFHVRGATDSWIKFIAFVEALRNAEDGEEILFLYPPVFPLRPLEILPATNHITLLKDPGFFHLDAIRGKNTPRNLALLDFMIKFMDTEFTVENSIDLVSELFPQELEGVSRKCRIGLSQINPFHVEKDALARIIEFPELFLINNNQNGKRFLYGPGDVCVNLGTNKYIAQELSKPYFKIKSLLYGTREDRNTE
jgi:hypothetical protein